METANVHIIRGIVLIVLVGYLSILSYVLIKLPKKRENILRDQFLWLIWIVFNLPFVTSLSFFDWELFIPKEIIAIWIYSSLLYVAVVVLLTPYGKFYYFWNKEK